MVDTTWAQLVTSNPDLIFKALGGGAAFVAPMSSSFPLSLTGTASAVLQELPAGYKCLGHLDKTGARFGRETTSSSVLSWGAKEPTRIDVTSDVHTTQVIAQETNLQTLALDLNADPEDLIPDATTGELVFNAPDAPSKIYNRLIIIARDVRSNGEVYFARGYPKAEVSARTGQQYQDSDDAPIQYDLTFTGFKDASAGTAVRYYFGGPGFKDLLGEMGFPEDSSSSV
jgi:hypothetical protein